METKQNFTFRFLKQMLYNSLQNICKCFREMKRVYQVRQIKFFTSSVQFIQNCKISYPTCMRGRIRRLNSFGEVRNWSGKGLSPYFIGGGLKGIRRHLKPDKKPCNFDTELPTKSKVSITIG